MIHPAVKSLFKYRPLMNEDKDGDSQFKHAVEMISNKSAYFSDPNGFNDPFDCKLDCIKRSNYDDPSESNLSDLLDCDLKWTISRRINQHGVLSLSENSQSILMWSHYARRHTGICIEYERNEKNILGNDAYARPVRYTDLYPQLSFDDARHLGLHRQVALDDPVLSTYFLTKSSCWSYEREWRVIRPITPSARVMDLTDVTIRSVIFGLMARKEHEQMLRNALKNNNIIFKKAVKGNKQFEINIQDES